MLLVQTDRDALLKTLQSVTGIVERRHTLPILSNVLLEGKGNSLSFTATDLEIQVKADSEEVKFDSDFAITTSAKKLQDILRALAEGTKISLNQQDSKVLVKAGKSKFNLQTLPAEDFPKFPVAEGNEQRIEISQKTLKNLLNQVQFAMAQQDIRYYLNGMLVVLREGKIRVVATDGHRLSYAESPIEENVDIDAEVIVPRKTVTELLRLLADIDEKVALEIGKNQIKFSFNNVTLNSKIVEGKFPDYTKVIPAAYKNMFSVGRLTLLQALQRAAILSNEKFRGVRMVLTKDSVSIISSNSEQEEAQEDVEISYDGDAIDIGFNVSYLLDVLNNVNSQEIECSFGDSNSSGVFTLPGNHSFKYVVMPMRI
jgi:DNA polymerase III subunit beta